MDETIKIKSTSKHSAIGGDIVLREKETTKLIFRPEEKRDTSQISAMKKGSRKITHEGKGNMDLKSLESQNMEFKSNWRDEYLKVICAFANADGWKLIIGIRP